MEEFVVYILFSQKYHKSYVGYTTNLIERFKSHNELSKKGYTKNYRPWIVIHVAFFNSKTLALNREKYLKTGVGREFVKKLSTNYINEGLLSAAADKGSSPVPATK